MAQTMKEDTARNRNHFWVDLVVKEGPVLVALPYWKAAELAISHGVDAGWAMERMNHWGLLEEDEEG